MKEWLRFDDPTVLNSSKILSQLQIYEMVSNSSEMSNAPSICPLRMLDNTSLKLLCFLPITFPMRTGRQRSPSLENDIINVNYLYLNLIKLHSFIIRDKKYKEISIKE